MLRRFVCAFAALSLLLGCAIHPVPEDVTGVDTYDIVRQIRCETREAIRKAVIDWLTDLGQDHESQPGVPLARKLALQYANEPDSISTFHANLFKGPEFVQVRAIINLFYDAGIAYNFELTMTEDNDLATDISLLKPTTHPKFTLGASAGAKRKRTNNRTFTVTDTFSYLVTKLNIPVRGEHYCDGYIVQANYVYPIAGRIGVDKLVNDFIRLTLFTSLGGAAAKPGERGAPTMADKLTFTTALNASANPKIEFTPVGRGFQFASASLTAGVTRTDVHQVTVALAIAPGGLINLDPLRSYLFSAERTTGAAGPARRGPAASSLLVGRRVTGGGSPSEVLAVIAIDQLKSREFEIIPAP